jgi:transposase-like protein
MGRRSPYRAEFHPEEAKRLAQTGMTELEIAGALGISETTFAVWKRRYAQFQQAITEGKKEPNRLVEAAVIKRALGHKVREVHYRPPKKEGDPAVPIRIVERDLPGNTRAMEFWLSNRMPKKWKRKVNIDMGMASGRVEERDPEKLTVLRKNMLLLMGATNGGPHKQN